MSSVVGFQSQVYRLAFVQLAHENVEGMHYNYSGDNCIRSCYRRYDVSCHCYNCNEIVLELDIANTTDDSKHY